MSKLYDLLSAMCRKIKKSDWNQNDPTAPDYVKNRPFWEEAPEEKVLFQETLELEEPYIGIEGCSFMFEEGKEYKVDFNGENYTCIAYYYDAAETTIIGNLEWDGEEPSGNNEPFVIMVWDDGYIYIAVEEPGEYNISITGIIAEVHKIDSKYIDTRAIEEKAEEAYYMADEARYGVENVWGYIDYNVPKFVNISWTDYGYLEPDIKEELQVGERSGFGNYPDKFNDAVTNFPIGSQICGSFELYYGNNKSLITDVVLNKITSYRAEGGTWVMLNGVPRYYYITLYENKGNANIERYV